MGFLVQGGAPPDDSVSTAKIKSDAVTSAKIADDAIDSEHYTDGSIDTAHIAANAIDETKLKDALVADFTEVTVVAGDSILLGDASDSGNTKRDTVQGILDLTSSGSKKIGSFTRATSAGAGTQAVTGVGFTPSHVIFFAENGAENASWGFDDGTSHISITKQTATVFVAGGSFSISSEAGSYVYRGTITTLGSDGFTITWTTSGSPSGIVTCQFMAFE